MKLNAVGMAPIPPRAAMLAAGVVGLISVAVLAATTGWAGGLTSAVDHQMAGMGLKVDRVLIQGASPEARRDIMAALGVHQDLPILGLNLTELRGRVEGVGWVRDAKVMRLLPDTLMVVVDERRPAAVWQHRGRSIVIDASGRKIEEADAGLFPSLPLVVGAGADINAPKILAAVAARPRLAPRVEALVRVDDRRWDLRLKDGGLIQLPALEEESALIQLDQLDARQRILDLGFARIDLRTPEAIAVRPRAVETSDQLLANGA